MFTKQLCFIGSHKVVQYLVNCFSDNQAIPAFSEQMGDTFPWITFYFKSCSKLWNMNFCNQQGVHAISQNKLSNPTRGFQLFEEKHTFKRCCGIRNGLPDPQILSFCVCGVLFNGLLMCDTTWNNLDHHNFNFFLS